MFLECLEENVENNLYKSTQSSDFFKPENNVILIDFENLQPKDINLLQPIPCLIKIILGANQKRVNVAFLKTIEAKLNSIEFKPLENSGKNCLDFYISYLIGKISKDYCTQNFYILSKDKGFDPFIKQISKEEQISIYRCTSISEIIETMFKTFIKFDTSHPHNQPPHQELTSLVNYTTKKLLLMHHNKPKTPKTLINFIENLFYKKLNKIIVFSIISQLCKQNLIFIENEKILYNLPDNYLFLENQNLNVNSNKDLEGQENLNQSLKLSSGLLLDLCSPSNNV